jgi:Ser/Thr protein kinase RdoA (MazF antagonist)
VNETTERTRALGGWRLHTAEARPLGRGSLSEHWLVESPDGSQHLLRRYRPRRATHAIAYEHELLGFLADRGWPVATPIPTADGATFVETDSGRWSLFPFLEGEAPPRETLFQQRRGAVLALLHADLAEWDASGRRAGWGRVDDLDLQARASGFPSFEAVTASYAPIDPKRASALAGFRYRNLAQLERLRYSKQPAVVTYNGCLANNVLFEGDSVTALLNFDLAHEDARVADIARSLVVDCWPDELHLHYWMAGYAAHARPRLTPEEVDLLPALMLANELWNTVLQLTIGSRAVEPWTPESVHAALDERLPRLEAGQVELRRLLRAAVGFPN